ncbi:MAG: PIG-L family deacetylase [Planctomycetota bacterium]
MITSKSRTVLAVGAHPDDIEFLGAGTLALLYARGWRVWVATMTAGDMGSARLGRDEISRVRLGEASKAAALLEAEYRCLGATDFGVYFGDALCRRTAALLRAARPDLVLTHAPIDYVADHEEASRIVRQACFAAPVRNYDTRGEETRRLALGEVPTASIPHLYYFDAVEGKDYFGQPVPAAIIVDISSTIETKAAMLACHESQRDWLREHHGTDHYIEQMRAWSAQRGAEVEIAYGEAFRQHRGHAFPRSDLLREVLGELVHCQEGRPRSS